MAKFKLEGQQQLKVDKPPKPKLVRSLCSERDCDKVSVIYADRMNFCGEHGYDYITTHPRRKGPANERA